MPMIFFLGIFWSQLVLFTSSLMSCLGKIFWKILLRCAVVYSTHSEGCFWEIIFYSVPRTSFQMWNRKPGDWLNPCLLVMSGDKLCKQLDPDQAWQNIGPDLDPNCLKLLWYLWNNFSKKLILKKISRRQKHAKFPSRQSQLFSRHYFCPVNVVCFLCLLFIFRCTSD